jgi:carboxymethylenebutenolidase
MIRSPLSRREVIKFGAFTSVGGVLTPGISMAQAIVTDTKGISARDIQLNVKGTTIPGYEHGRKRQALPDHRRDLGLHGSHRAAQGRRPPLRQAGYYAVAPELFHREGGMQGKPQPELARISAGIGRAQYLGDIRAATDHAKAQTAARADRIGVTGFCGGARSRCTSRPRIPTSRRRCPGTATSSGSTTTRRAWTPSAW